MNKEEILKMSQKENKGKKDEFEVSVSNKASSVSMAVGGVVCVLLSAFELFFLDTTYISTVAFMLYTYMAVAEKLCLYRYLKKRSDLFWLILSIAVALSFTAIFVYKIITKDFS